MEHAADRSRRRPARKWRFTRPEKSRTVLLAEAVAVALAGHALLLAISFREPVPVAANGTDPGLTILSKRSLGLRDADFRRWLEVHDPERFAASSSACGYLAQLPEPERPRPLRKLDFVAPTVPEAEGEAFAPAPVAPKRLALPELPRPAAPPLRLLVVDGRGKPVELKMEDPGVGASALTHLVFHRAGRLGRVDLISSCGDPELDLLAKKALYRAAAKLDDGADYLFYWPGTQRGGAGK